MGDGNSGYLGFLGVVVTLNFITIVYQTIQTNSIQQFSTVLDKWVKVGIII